MCMYAFVGVYISPQVCVCLCMCTTEFDYACLHEHKWWHFLLDHEQSISCYTTKENHSLLFQKSITLKSLSVVMDPHGPSSVYSEMIFFGHSCAGLQQITQDAIRLKSQTYSEYQ